MKLIHPTAIVTMPIAMQKIGCRPDRTGDNPDDASKDDRERNEIGEDYSIT
jgi:hypothetical protein